MHAQRRAEPRRAAGGHHMRGAGNVIAHHFGGELAQEQAAGVADPAGPRPGIRRHQAQVLRGDAVGHGDGLRKVVHQDDAALPFQSAADGVGAGVGGNLIVQLRGHRLNQSGGVGDQDGGGHRVVFRLGDEVGGAEARVGGFVGHNDGFRGAEHAVNVHLPLHHSLGTGDEHIAGAADFVHLGDAFRAVGQGADGRDAAHLIDGIHAGDAGGGEDGGVEGRRALPRGGQDDLGHAGHAGGDGGHQHGGGVSRRAAGGIQADPFQRTDQFAQAAAQVNPVAGQSGAVKVGDAGGGQFQGLLQVVRGGVPGRVQFRCGDAQIVRCGAVQQPGVAADGGVALVPHGLQHLPD